MALRTKFIQRVITARNTPVDNEVVYEAPVDLDHVVAEINEHIETEESVHSTVEKLENLKASMERFAEGGELPESAKFFAGIVYKDALKSGGLVVDEVSLESYAEEISLESVTDTIKRVWKTIFEFLSGLFKKVVGFFARAEEQADIVVKETEEIIESASNMIKESEDLSINDESALFKLAKIGLVKSSGKWKVHVPIASKDHAAKVTDPGHSLDAVYAIFRSDARDVISQLDTMIDIVSGKNPERDALTMARNVSSLIGNVAQQLKLRPVESLSEDESLYMPRYPVFGGYAIALIYSEDAEYYVNDKDIVLIEYIPDQLEDKEITTTQLIDHLKWATKGLAEFKEYRKKISSKFSGYADFLEKFDVDKLAEYSHRDDPAAAREYAERMRGWIKWCMGVTTGPVIIKTYTGVVKATRTASKILKDAVKE